ncbi:hypothetical protein FACS189474_4520 [Bacteroidia bacterium]|nr:hypothetical protein FACS189474_4520 [Bacteroidia bacterium]
MIQTLLNIGKTIQFLLDLIFKENLKNYISKDTILSPILSSEIRILANGPSLKDFVQNYTTNDVGYEYFVMNDFANYEAFETIKPKFYVLSDPLFFLMVLMPKEVKSTFRNNEKSELADEFVCSLSL